MFSSAIAQNVDKKWGWLIGVGVLMVIAGLIAITFVGVTSMLSVIYLGALFMIGGIAEIIFAFSTRPHSDMWYHLLFGLLFAVAGYFIFSNPIPNMVFLTMLIAAVFMITGISTLVTSVVERFSNWGWFALNGVIATVAAFLIFRNPLASSIWLIGMLVGLEFIFRGCAWISLGFTGRAVALGRPYLRDEPMRPAHV
jgi:uncharacterized membrane protein HdeD (DUF308 family)